MSSKTITLSLEESAAILEALRENAYTLRDMAYQDAIDGSENTAAEYRARANVMDAIAERIGGAS